MSRKAAIFGGSGQLGMELAREMRSRGYDVTSFSRQSVDIADREAVESRIGGLDPSIVLNAAAYNHVDVAEQEPQAAFSINALAVRNLALACRQTGARLVHFSTDYVFDGTASRPYTEEDRVHPLGAYGISKLAGEFYAQAYLDDPLVIRTSGVFGPGGLRTARGNFIELMLRMARTNHTVRVVEDHVASPTYAPALASRTADLIQKAAKGIYHLGGGTPISWFEYARLIFSVAGLEPNLVPTNEREFRTAARRPRYSALSNEKAEQAGIRPMPPLEDAVRHYFEARRSLEQQGRPVRS